MVSYPAVRRPGRNWLSLTPEPELELPAAIATLRHGIEPAPDVERERARAEQLVVRGSRRRWERWLDEARALARSQGDDPATEDARAAAMDVISNHDALKLGLAERGGRGGRGR
jgi:MoxR-like ATPase